MNEILILFIGCILLVLLSSNGSGETKAQLICQKGTIQC